MTAITALAQQEIELNSSSYSGPIPNGPTTSPQIVSFRHNTVGATFVGMTNPVSVTATLSNQQYTGLAGNVGSGVTIGTDFTSIPNSPNVIGVPVFGLLNTIGSPSDATYTSNPYGAAGTGIVVTQNYAYSLFSTANMWIGTLGPAGRRAYYADISFTFSRPVSDPVIHINGFGASLTGGNNYTTELELPAASGFTLTKLSGSGELTIPATNDKILNGTVFPNAVCGSGAACGSVRINGTNITSVTFRIFVRFRNTNFPATFAAGSQGDMYLLSFSFATFNLSGTVYDDANGLTDNTVNGAVTNAGGSLYALAIDAFGNVQGTTLVSAAGAFSFPNLVKGSYTVRLSTTPGTYGSSAPATSIPPGWVYTGEFQGAGAGSDGSVNGNLAGNIVTSDVTNFNLGIERPPVANNILYQLAAQPVINSVLALNGAIGAPVIGSIPIRPNGTDAEDGLQSTGSTMIINTLPANGTLLYNGIAVTAGQVIAGFNQNLLAMRFNGTGYKTINFSYSFRDLALVSSTPATYTIFWDSPLPVTLTNFTAARQNKDDVLLKWQTASEQNNRGFSVEHGSDGLNFETIQFVNGAGNSGTVTDYNYLHRNAGNGSHYYRLKQTDLDGNAKFSDTRLVIIDDKQQAAVYPNPADERIYIKTATIFPLNELSLFDLTGRPVFQQQYFPTNSSLDISRFPAGIYLLKIQFREGGFFYKKIIKK